MNKYFKDKTLLRCMGIKNLKNILISKCSSAIVQRKLNSYNGNYEYFLEKK